MSGTATNPRSRWTIPAERALTRRAAIAGTVLLRNAIVDTLGRPALPIPTADLSRVAVVGPNAVIDRSMGGGSASLTPFGHRTLLDALTDRLAERSPATSVTYDPGVRIDRLTPIVRRGQLRTPAGEPGLRLEYVNGRDWDAPAVIDTDGDDFDAAILRHHSRRGRPVGVRLRGSPARSCPRSTDPTSSASSRPARSP